jgi:uncharacterized membrane protein
MEAPIHRLAGFAEHLTGDIGQLGASAVIRPFLNYFLEQDLDHADAAGEAQEPIQS